jgi:hypothetical protein
VHNTIIQSGSSGSTGLSIIGAHCAAINNILLAYGGTLAYDQFGATDLLSDHNVIFSTCTYLARDGGNYYFNFDAYRAATGRDSGSHFTDVSFTTDSLGIHLSECEAQNRDLEGIPLPDVPIDFYGARRDTVKPFVGAVEGVRLPYDMFGAPFKASLPGFAVSLAEGEFDNASAPGIAVTDYDHRQLLLFHNNGASRSFSPAGTLATGFRPTVVRLFDLDGDSHLDLIVAGDTTEASIEVFWGNGTGGFSGPASVATNGRVRSLRGGPRFVNFSTVVTTEDNGFLPNKGFIGYLMCSAGRQLCYDVQTTGPNAMPDTVLAVMDDFVLADVGGGRSMPAVAAPGIFGSTNPQPKFLVFDVAPISDAAAKCQQASARFLSNDLEFSIPSTGYYTAGSSIIWGDFDSDGDNDFLTTGWSEDYCVFIRNQGGFSFTADTIPASAARGLVALDYENDGDLDFVTINRTLDSLGVTVFLNSGAGQFAERRNCYYPFASGWPNGIVARDFDSDGKTDIAVIGKTMSGGDSLFVLYNLGGFNTVTGIVDRRPTEGPQGFLVSQNYPNPFNPSTHIEYTIQVPAHVTVTIYNLLGQTVRSLVAEDQPGGRHVIEWDGNSALGTPVSTGVYLCRIEARRIADLHVFADVKKMLLMK